MSFPLTPAAGEGGRGCCVCLIDASRAVSSPQTNAPAPLRISAIEIEIQTKNIVAKQSVFIRLFDNRIFPASNREWIFCADVNETTIRAHL